MALQDSDNFIVGRGDESYKITYQDLKDDLNYVPPPVGTIDTPTVLSPNDGAGGGDTSYINSDTITKVEGGGTNVYTTDTIASVDAVNIIYENKGSESTQEDCAKYLKTNNGKFNGSYNKISFVFSGPNDDYDRSVGSETGGAGAWIEWNLKDQGYPPVQVNSNVLVQAHQSGSHQVTAYDINNSQLASATTDSSGRATLNFTGEMNRVRVARVSGGAGSHIGNIRIDGTAIEWGVPLPSNSTALTFPTDNNFDKFEVGDVVQGVPSTPNLRMFSYASVTNGANIPTIASMVDRGSVSSYNTQAKTIDGLTASPALSSTTYTVIGAGSSSVPITFTSAYSWNTAPTWGTNDNGVTWTNVDSTNPAPTGATSNTYVGYQYYTWVSAGGTINTAASNFEFGDDSTTVAITAIDEAGPTITVDGGSWYGADGSGDAGNPDWYVPSQEWSNNFYGSPTPSDPLAAFNGVLQTGVNSSIVTTYSNEPIVWRSPDLISGNIKVYSCANSGGYDFTIVVSLLDDNNVEISSQSFTNVGNDVFSGDFTSVSDARFVKVQMTYRQTDPQYSILTGIEINGKLLVDSSIPTGAGATDITKTVAYNTKLTVASDKDLDNMSGTVFMTDGSTNADGTFVPASYTPQTSEIASVNTVDTSTYEYKSHTGQVALGSLTYTSADSGPETVSSGVKPSTSLSDSYWAFIKFNGSAKVNWGPPNSGTTKNVSYFYSDDGVNWVFDSSYSQSSGNFPGPFADSINSAVYWALCYQRTIDGSAITTLNDVPQAPFIPNNWYQFTVPTPLSTLTFNTPNPDLQYFEVGDVVQGQETPTLTATTENNVDEWVTNWNDSNGWTSSTNNMTMTWNISGPANIVFKGVRKSSDNPTMTLSVDGVQVDSVVWGTATAEVSATLPAGNNVVTLKGSRTFRVYSNQSTIDGQFFKINQQASITATDTAANTMTVDGGSWYGQDGSGDSGDGRYEPSQEWSQGVSGCTAGTAEGIFNGVTTDGGGVLSNPINTPMTIDFDGLPAGEVIVTLIGDGNATWSLQTNTEPAETFAGQSTTVITKNLGNITLSKLTFQSISQTGAIGGGQIYSISVGGKLLVDSSIPGGGGETNVTGSTETAEGTFLSADGTEVDLSDSSGRWIADNKAGTAFSIAGPSKIDDPLLTNDVELRSSNFSTTPGSSDTLKEIIWDIDGTEYSAGVTNPWSPLSNLTPNTTHTVKVKHKGNTLEDSSWSPTVSFTTGATLRSIVTRIASLEANDITDDATDTTLLTLIAGLTSRIAALEADHTTLMNNNGNNSGY